MQGKDGGAAVITKGKISTGNRAMDELQLNVLSNQAQQRADYFQQEKGGVLEEGKQMLQKEMSRGTSSSSFGQSSRDRRQANAPAALMPQGGMHQSLLPATESDALKDSKSGVNSFVLNQFVEFPSRDGFDISLDMTVEFELEPAKIPRLFRDYGDLPAVVEKILMPQILSVSRLKGSAYRAVDFIVGEGREKFQVDLTGSLKKSLADRSIAIHNALIRHVNVPAQILEPIQQASVAQEQDLTNKEKQNTARKQAELNTEQSLIEQRGAEVAQETAKLKAEIKANQEKKVAEIQAGTLKLAAEIDKQAAEIRAQKVRKLGLANAELTQRIEGERAKGFQMKVQALGDATAYNLAEFAGSLNPQMKINILHAGDGTLWTDLERASLGDLGGAKVLKK
jgi:regulator of protease activity HflC (stomatin/prohibitin superfamily)